MINLKDPMMLSLSAFSISFITLMILFQIFKPKWVQYNNKTLSLPLSISYSITFSLVVAISIILFNNSTTQDEVYDYNMQEQPQYSK